LTCSFKAALKLCSSTSDSLLTANCRMVAVKLNMPNHQCFVVS